MEALRSGLFNAEALEERARNLGTRNGLKRLFVSLPAGPLPAFADVRLEFFNANGLPQIVSDAAADLRAPAAVFPVTGGVRLRAGTDPGRVQVTSVAAGPDAQSLALRVAPVGDYSTYALGWADASADPLFARIEFKFRPGCFNLNCAGPAGRSDAPPEQPGIDYLARDYDSFKHLLIEAMRRRVPGWEPTSEADLDQVVIDLLAAEGDLLSDYQDRVMNEAYLATARKRTTLARHARLMDYHIHQGNQSVTWLALRMIADAVLPAGFGAWTGRRFTDPGAVPFALTAPADLRVLLNEVRGYTWGAALDALEAGCTEADLALPAPLNPVLASAADSFRDLFRAGGVPRLLLEQKLNPETGTPNGRDPGARQLVTLLEGNAAADSVFDPAAGRWLVRVRWREEDRLARRFCLVSRCAGLGPVEDVSVFHGNLAPAAQGRPHRLTCRPPHAELGPGDDSAFLKRSEGHWEVTPYGVACRLVDGPLAYRDTPPGGEQATRSTLRIEVSGFLSPWEEQSDLIESGGGDAHFQVETDEEGNSLVRFGDGINGLPPPDDAVITCAYQVGQGVSGNVGADAITGFDAAAFPAVGEVWNPFDVSGGREPEPPEEIKRRAPEAFRARQLRAVTLEDYARRAEELDGVSAARAFYAWTGSWRSVRVAIDPKGTTELTDLLRRRIADSLEAVRLIGEDLEVRPARYAPLDIHLKACIHDQYWPEDVRQALEEEFAEGFAADGRPGFFHPDSWTFGQPLYASQIIGRALAVTGVERVLRLGLRRWDPGTGGGLSVIVLTEADLPSAPGQKIEVRPDEIVRVANDPDRIENGRMTFTLVGGRR